MIDTHAHLQFKAFEGKVDQVIESARNAGVEKIIVVGTNLETSRKAVELAKKHEGLFASIGIHPHHIFPYITSLREVIDEAISELESLINHPKVVAIGETGLDRHIYESTKYKDYQITEEFLNLQKLFFKEQIKLAIKHQKTLVIHNRKAVPELLEILESNWNPFLEGRSVFHCCEPNQKLLDFALKHKVFIGIDGDITYDNEKQKFLKKVPLESIVLETDSPYFLPEPLKARHSQASLNNNEPKNLKIIVKFITKLKDLKREEIEKVTQENSEKLFMPH